MEKENLMKSSAMMDTIRQGEDDKCNGLQIKLPESPAKPVEKTKNNIGTKPYVEYFSQKIRKMN